MKPQLVTAPARYPVSLAEARQQLGFDTQDRDPFLAQLIAAATEHVETYTGRALITRTYKGYLNGWPCDPQGWAQRFIRLEKPPLQAVAHVVTYDDSDAATTFDAANYYVDSAGAAGRLVLRRFAVWPVSLALRVANAIEVQWTAGYGDNPGDAPETLRIAVQMMVGVLNEQRGDETAPPMTPPAVQLLLAPYLTQPFA